MALKKCIAAMLQPDGTWSEQKDIEMHPLEEAEMQAHWAMCECINRCPKEPTKDEEHEWLIEHGAEYVKQKRAEVQAAKDAMQAEMQAAHDNHQQCVKAWHDHVEHCLILGFDPNTYDVERYRK